MLKTKLCAGAFAALIAIPFATAASQKLTGPNSTVAPPAPVSLDTTGMFQARFVKVGGDVFIGGQPTKRRCAP